MIELTFRPLVDWPWPVRTSRRMAPFKTGWSRTRFELEREIGYLECRRPFLEIEIEDYAIRQDGQPKGGIEALRPRGPRVVLNLPETKHGDLRYPCDAFDLWISNVRALRLALEDLRRIDRYGVGARGEQYTGWKRIAATSSQTKTAQSAADLLMSVLGIPGTSVPTMIDDLLTNPEKARIVVRSALRLTHPDSSGGESGRFHAVQEARAVLAAHFGGAL